MQIEKLNKKQIQAIISKVIPMIADPKDHEFFSGILWIKAENSTPADFGYFVSKLLLANDSQ